MSILLIYLISLYSNFQKTSSFLPNKSFQEFNLVITANSDDEYDDEEGSEEEQENEEIEQNA